jgi:DNA repair/transcription protein MET18/MMS19
MASCITGYSISIVLEWVNKIWDSLKFEVWNGENEEFIQGALKVINSIASAFTFGPLALNAQIQEAKRFISSILKECVDRMVDSKQRYMSSTGRILYAVASSSQYMFAQVTKSTLPALLLLWEDLTYSSEKGSLLEVFNAILQARTEVGGNSQKDFNNPPHSASETADWDQSKIEFTSALITFKEKLVDSVYWAAMAVNVMNTPDDTIFRVNTIKGLVLLTRIPNFLTDGEQGTIIDTLNKMGFGSSQRDEIHTQAISALQQVSVYDPARFSAITLPSFSSHLPGGISNKVVEDGETETLMSALDDLVNIACKEPCIVQDRSISFPKHAVFDAFQEVMMSKLLHLLNAEKEQTEYARIVIAAISLGLKKFDAALDVGAADHVLQPSTSEPSQHPYAGIVLRLFKSLAKVRHDSSGGSYIGIQLVSEKKDLEMLITEVGNIATLALRSKQTKAENNFLNGSSGSSSIWSLFTGAEVTKSQMDLRNASSDKYLAIAMSMSLVAGIKREVCT